MSIFNNKELPSLLEFISKIPLFSVLEFDQVRLLLPHFQVLAFNKGEYIYRQGDLDQRLLIVYQGNVVLMHSIQDNYEEVKDIYSSSMFFGEMSLFTTNKRQCNAKATTYCELLSLHKEDFDKLIAENEKLATFISKQYMEIVRKEVNKNKYLD